jgi:uncharacterized membrane protein (DUF373 family)
MLIMGVVVVLSIVDLAYTVLHDILTPPIMLIAVDRLPEILGLFLWILIAIELLESIRVYLTRHAINVETVVIVSIIAIARKVIVLDVHELDGSIIIGLAAIIAALTGGYFLLRKSHTRPIHQEENDEI